jgi:hypothetical protein
MSTNATNHKMAPDAGDFITEDEANRLRGNFCTKSKRKWNHDNYIQAYFFGKDRLQALLNCQDDIAGLRIFFGADTDNDGIDDRKMVIYAVDHNGKNILYKGEDQPNIGAGTDDGGPTSTGGGKVLDAGIPCPTNCG